MSKSLSVTLPAQTPAQRQVVSEAARFNVVDCGRRWGKSWLGQDRLVCAAVTGMPVAWFSPTYRMLSESWRSVREILQPITVTARADEHRLELLGGGTVDMWSLDAADTARGRRYGLVVIDEAALADGLEQAWQNVIRPTLTDLKGGAWFLSTPRGLNYFWQLWTVGQDGTQPDWRSWQMPTSSNPYIDKGEIEAAKRQLPERVFAQEYMASFIEDAGVVFRGIGAAVMSNVVVQPPEAGHSYVCGLDWGKLNDYTVVSIIDATTHEQVLCDRFNRIDYEFQLSRLLVHYDNYRPYTIVAESNSVGEPLIEQLRRAGLPVRAFNTSPSSKTKLIEDLALAFERGALRLLDQPVQTNELLSFAAERLPSGAFRYAAPGSGHDDTVMALGLAWSAVAQELPAPILGKDPFARVDPTGPGMTMSVDTERQTVRFVPQPKTDKPAFTWGRR